MNQPYKRVCFLSGSRLRFEPQVPVEGQNFFFPCIYEPHCFPIDLFPHLHMQVLWLVPPPGWATWVSRTIAQP